MSYVCVLCLCQWVCGVAFLACFSFFSPYLKTTTMSQSVARLSRTVTLLPGLNPSVYTLSGTNTYLVGSGASRLLIDTGGPKSPVYVSNLVNCLSLNGCSLKAILCTHWHKDHTGGIASLLQVYPDTPVHKFRLGTFEKMLIKNPIVHEEVFKVEGATLQALHTPGHAMDHMCFYLKEEEALFSGDLVLGGSTVVFNDLEKYLLSLQILLQQRPRLKRIYPGHGTVVEQGRDKINQDLEHRKLRERQILEAVSRHRSGANVAAIVDTIYAGYSEELKKAAEGGVKLHLLYLEKKGKVSANKARVKQTSAAKEDSSQIFGPGGLSLSQIHNTMQRRESLDFELAAAERAATGQEELGDSKGDIHIAHLALAHIDSNILWQAL